MLLSFDSLKSVIVSGSTSKVDDFSDFIGKSYAYD